MNTQQGSSAADNPDVKLQQLSFLKTQDDNRAAVYQAKIGNLEVPDEPVLEFTVTMASPAGDDKAEREIKEFLSEVQAGLAVTSSKPDGGQGGDQDPDVFDVDNEILFETKLIRPDASKGPFGVIVVIQVAVKGYSVSERVPIALADGVLRVASWIVRRRVRSYNVTYVNSSVVNGKCHRHRSRTGGNMSARVTIGPGSAKVFPGNHIINQGGNITLVVIAVRVCGNPNCSYTVREVT
jgi:hypothetical protein